VPKRPATAARQRAKTGRFVIRRIRRAVIPGPRPGSDAVAKVLALTSWPKPIGQRRPVSGAGQQGGPEGRRRHLKTLGMTGTHVLPTGRHQAQRAPQLGQFSSMLSFVSRVSRSQQLSWGYGSGNPGPAPWAQQAISLVTPRFAGQRFDRIQGPNQISGNRSNTDSGGDCDMSHGGAGGLDDPGCADCTRNTWASAGSDVLCRPKPCLFAQDTDSAQPPPGPRITSTTHLGRIITLRRHDRDPSVGAPRPWSHGRRAASAARTGATQFSSGCSPDRSVDV